MLTDAEIDAALLRGEELGSHEPRAIAARYDCDSGRVVVDLMSGCVFTFPAALAQITKHIR